MGNKCCTGDAIKDGISFKKYRSKIRPFDLFMFRGQDAISDLIAFAQARELGEGGGEFSHIGMAVTSEILDHPDVEEGKMYVWESTMSGPLSGGVKNVKGASFLGVQLRDFNDVIEAYDIPNDTHVAVCHLENNPANMLAGDNPAALKKKFTEIFNKYDGVPYDANLLSLVSSLIDEVRSIGEASEEELKTSKWLFCSELVSTVYRDMGIFPSTVIPKNVVPMDFLGFDLDSEAEGGIPSIVSGPVYLVTDLHLRKESEKKGEDVKEEEDNPAKAGPSE